MRGDAEGVLVIWNDIAEDWEAEFLRWHVREHIPERVGLPGFLRGQRYVALDARPKYFNFYEAQHATAFSSDAYRERLNNPTAWTRKVVAHFANTARTICRRVATAGRGDGAWVETVRLSVAAGADFLEGMNERTLSALASTDGVVAASLLQGIPSASGSDFAEKKLRSQPDQVADWVLMVEALTPVALMDPDRIAEREAVLLNAGALPGWQRGVYQLQYGLSAMDGRAT